MLYLQKILDMKELKLHQKYRLTEITIKAKLASYLVILVFYCDGSSTSDWTRLTVVVIAIVSFLIQNTTTTIP